MQTNVRSSRRRRRRERGQTLAEFALVAPIFFLLVFGFIDMARLYQSWVTIQHAAREGARYGVTGRADCNIASPTREACIEHVARTQTEGLNNPAGDLTVGFRSWDYPAYANPALDDSPGEQCDAIEVNVGYAFSAATPILSQIIGEFHITARERLVNEPFGPCAAAS
ncbi:MAG: TadE family protein [Dehalococcoidia bacterium]